ncbi:MAG TPA: T9SS type A sorting domain-containing protein, partial [Taishania sp.]|nr:T9SS type A sorting domain-containing protein [Taishania sp.]
QPIVVYPNPVQTKLFIQTQAELVRVRVIDVTGKEIAVNRDENSINVAHLSDGYYQLLIETTKGNYQTKFIKNK